MIGDYEFLSAIKWIYMSQRIAMSVKKATSLKITNARDAIKDLTIATNVTPKNVWTV